MSAQEKLEPGVPLALGHERIAQLAIQRRLDPPAKGTWGVWCLHERIWVDNTGHRGERDAWRALVQVTTRHPWELRVARPDDIGLPMLPMGEGKPPCDTCGGTGDCQACDGLGDCADCAGTGKEET